MRLAWAFFLVLAFGLAACSTDDQGADQTTATTTSATLASTTTATTLAPPTTVTTTTTTTTTSLVTTTTIDPAELIRNPRILGERLPKIPHWDSDVVDPGIGEQIPEVLGADYEGNLVTIENNGQAKMLLFFAHWCGGSAKEVPRVLSWLDEHQLPDNVELISVSTHVYRPPTDRYPPSEWLDNAGWTVPVIVDDEMTYNVNRAFGEGGFPYWVMVGLDGIVVDRIQGWNLVDIDEWTATLSEL